MKKMIYWMVILAVFSSVPLVAQTLEANRKLSAFSAVKISHAIEAELVKGDHHGIEITASGIDLENIETKVAGKVLEVKISRNNSRSVTVKVKITYVDIDQVSASTSAKVFVKDKIEAKNVKIAAASNGYIEAEVLSQNLDIEAETNSKIFITGKTQDLNLKGFTKAEIIGENLVAENAEVRVNTAANAKFRVNASIKGSAATTAKVHYTGDPNIVDVKTNTGGAIEQAP